MFAGVNLRGFKRLKRAYTNLSLLIIIETAMIMYSP